MEIPAPPRRRFRTKGEGPAPVEVRASHPNDRRGAAPTTASPPAEAAVAAADGRPTSAALRAFTEM